MTKKTFKINVGDVVYTNVPGTHSHNAFRIVYVDTDGFSNGTFSWAWGELGKLVFRSIEEAEKAWR